MRERKAIHARWVGEKVSAYLDYQFEIFKALQRSSIAVADEFATHATRDARQCAWGNAGDHFAYECHHIGPCWKRLADDDCTMVEFGDVTFVLDASSEEEPRLFVVTTSCRDDEAATAGRKGIIR